MKKLQKGSTVVELLLYMALLGIFLTVLLDVFVTTLNFKKQTESASSLNQDARYILARMSYDISNAESFSVPNSEELSFVSEGVTYRYTLFGGNLLLGAERLNGLDTQIGSLSFTQTGTTVQISVTVNSRVDLSSGTKSISLKTTLMPRI